MVITGLAVSAMVGCSEGNDGATVIDTDANRPFVLAGVEDFTEVAQLTGPDSELNDTEAVAVAGTDLGSMSNAGDRTYFVFGDTFGTRDPESHGGQGGNWRSNAMAYTTDEDPTDGISFDGWITDDIGFAQEILPGLHEAGGVGEVTKIPTQGFATDDAMYLQFMSIHEWGDAGDWDANHAGLARSTDDGQTWDVLDEPRWPGESNFIQLAAAEVSEDGEEYFYFWSIPSGRFGDIHLMKVRATSEAVEDPDAYRYFAGTDADSPVWAKDIQASEPVVSGPYGELSVMYSQYLDRWLMTTMTGDSSDAVMLEGITPWGPWSDPHIITSQSETPGLYAPYMNPRYVENDGQTIYFSMSLWGPYNVFWYRIDLQRAAG